MFGLVEASAWMHVRNDTFKMKELIGIKKRFGVPFSLVTFIWASKRKSLADRAKPKANKHQNESTSEDELKLPNKKNKQTATSQTSTFSLLYKNKSNTFKGHHCK